MTPMRMRLPAPPWSAAAAARVPATIAPDVAARNARRLKVMTEVYSVSLLRFVVRGARRGGNAVGARPRRMRGHHLGLNRGGRLVDRHALRLERGGAGADRFHHGAARRYQPAAADRA